MSATTESGPPKVSPLYDPRVRSIAYQVALCAIILLLVYGAVHNAVENLARARIASGFGFWNVTARLTNCQSSPSSRAASRIAVVLNVPLYGGCSRGNCWAFSIRSTWS